MLLEARPGLALEEVTTTAALERLRSQWRELWASCPTATPFQHPDWLLPWWRHFGEGELWTLAVRSEGRLVGLAPLYIYTQPSSGSRDVFLVGIGTSDYLEMLYEPASGAAAAGLVLRHLAAKAHRWDACDLQQLPPGSPLLSVDAPDGWGDETTAQEVCPVLRLPASEEELEQRISGRLLKNLRYCWRKVQGLGTARFERADPGNLEELFDAQTRLHGARWALRGLPGVLDGEAVLRANREALPGLLESGVLRLYALRLDGRIVASLYGFADRRRFYYYLGGFEPELERFSPGSLIVWHAIREAVREGAEGFDFLRGREAYKYRWGAADTPTFRRRLRVVEAEG